MSLSATGIPVHGTATNTAFALHVPPGVPHCAPDRPVTGDVARDLVIHRFDAFQERLGEIGRGEVAARHQAAGFGNAEQGEIGHGEGPYSSARENLRRLGGPRPMRRNALHQLQQADNSPCAGVRCPQAVRVRPDNAAQRAELLQGWCLWRRHLGPPDAKAACKPHAAAAWLAPCISGPRTRE